MLKSVSSPEQEVSTSSVDIAWKNFRFQAVEISDDAGQIVFRDWLLIRKDVNLKPNQLRRLLVCALSDTQDGLELDEVTFGDLDRPGSEVKAFNHFDPHRFSSLMTREYLREKGASFGGSSSRRQNRNRATYRWSRLDLLPDYLGFTLKLGDRPRRIIFSGADPLIVEYSLSLSRAVESGVRILDFDLFFRVDMPSGYRSITRLNSSFRLFSHYFYELQRAYDRVVGQLPFLAGTASREQKESHLSILLPKLVKNSFLRFLLDVVYGRRGIGCFLSRSGENFSSRFGLDSEEVEEFSELYGAIGEFPDILTQALESFLGDHRLNQEVADFILYKKHPSAAFLRSDPTGDKVVFNVLPLVTVRKLDQCLRKTARDNSSNYRKESIRLAYSIYQSRSILPVITKDFEEACLRSHEKILCSPETRFLPLFVRQKLSEVADRVGRRLSQTYHPGETSLPNRNATFTHPRGKGGCLKQLEEEGILRMGANPSLTDPLFPRMEPLVIGLFGLPGSGKTTRLNALVSHLTHLLNLPSQIPYRDRVYFRNPHSSHWDGFKNQPIVVMDDWGQGLAEQTEVREFDQCVSSATFLPPMANLDNKGIEFSSPIIIVTSNITFGSVIRDQTGAPIVRENLSIWRRFDLPFLVRPDGLLQKIRLEKDFRYKEQCRLQHSPITSDLQASLDSGGALFVPTVSYSEGVSDHLLWDAVRSSLREKVDTYFRITGRWPQRIRGSGSFCLDPHDLIAYSYSIKEGDWDEHESDFSFRAHLVFPSTPPLDPPRVRVSVVPESQKGRTITVGEGKSRCLKPFQDALLKVVSEIPEISLSRGRLPEEWSDQFDDDSLPLEAVARTPLGQLSRIQETLRRISLFRTDSNGRTYLSADYSSATDNFMIEVTQTLLEGILKHIDHQATRDWARWECSPSRIRYPWGERVQCRGQLMGSILSFPLLCLTNYTLCLLSGFDPGSFAVNGDDLVACVSPAQLSSWTLLSREIGLDPSPGKTFVTSAFLTLNSQLFFPPCNSSYGEIGAGGLAMTGKFSLIHRRDLPLSQCLYDLQQMYPVACSTQMFIRENSLKLQRTPCSPGVPRVYGGLAAFFAPKKVGFDLDLAIKVYFAKLYRVLYRPPVPIPGTRVSLVYLPYSTDQVNGQILRDHPIVLRLRRSVLLSRFSQAQEKDFTIEDDYSWMSFRNDYRRAEEKCLPSFFPNPRRLSSLPRLDSFQGIWVPLSNYVSEKAIQISVESTVRGQINDFLDLNRRETSDHYFDHNLVSVEGVSEESWGDIDLSSLPLFHDHKTSSFQRSSVLELLRGPVYRTRSIFPPNYHRDAHADLLRDIHSTVLRGTVEHTRDLLSEIDE